MTPQEFYDALMDSIHQFPLDCNKYERQMHRIDMAYKINLQRFEKSIQKLKIEDEENFKKIEKKINKLLKKMHKITENFERKIAGYYTTVEEFCNGCEPPITFTTPPEIKCCVVKIEDVAKSNKKYCICHEKASNMMACCSNPECIIKWFHFKCVGLNSPPRNEWYCGECKKEQ